MDLEKVEQLLKTIISDVACVGVDDRMVIYTIYQINVKEVSIQNYYQYLNQNIGKNGVKIMKKILKKLQILIDLDPIHLIRHILTNSRLVPSICSNQPFK